MSLPVRTIIGILSYIPAHLLINDISSGLPIIGFFFPLSWVIEDVTFAFLPDHPAFAFTRLTLLISVLFVIMIIWNICVYIIFRIDKRRAENNKWRIREKTLLLCVILFGAVGGWEAVFNLRHKSKHWNFKIIVTLALFAQLFFIFCLLRLSIVAWDIEHRFLNLYPLIE